MKKTDEDSLLAMKMPVTLRAVTQRMQRVLAKQGQKLVANRREPGWSIINVERNIHLFDVRDIEAEARELGALKDYEALEG